MEKTYHDFLIDMIIQRMFNGSLGVKIEKDVHEIVRHLYRIKSDIESAKKYDTEVSKMKPNQKLLELFKTRNFDEEKICSDIFLDSKAVESIEKAIGELVYATKVLEKYGLEPINKFTKKRGK